MTKKLKVAMIGGWGHGSNVISDFVENSPENAELVAMGQTCAEESLWDLPENYNNVTRYTDYKKMLEEVKPEIAVISTRLDLINETAIKAAASGCNLICEKPVAASKKQLHKLYQKVEQNQVKLMLLLNNRANPYLKAARALVKEGTIGDIVMVNARKSYPWTDDRVEKFPVKYGG
ncbi:MAG: Gfo/Idh/MocA family protein, partial [Bacillota bacterium]